MALMLHGAGNFMVMCLRIWSGKTCAELPEYQP
jgi:hypothetical protein